MTNLDFDELKKRSGAIRARYHELELEFHGAQWTVEEDALAFLTDAALVGRMTMANQNRWPQDGASPDDLKHKLGESIWWIAVLAHRMNIDMEEAVRDFLEKTENSLGVERPG